MILSRIRKLEGQKNYITYTFVNGLGYSFLAETIIYLLAIHFGAGNLALGYISSAVYLTGVIIFFVPVLFPNVRIIRLFFVAWILRGIICLLYGAVPFIATNMVVPLIIVTYTGYCLLRNIAYPLNPVIQGIITKPSERGEYSSRVIIFLYSSMMLSRFISFGVLSFPSLGELDGILILLGLGIVLNTGASFAIRRVPVEEKVNKQNIRESLKIFTRYLRTPMHLVFILLYCGGMSLIVLFNFSIPFLRKVLNVPSNLIFIFTTINFLGVIISSRLLRPFLDRFGSKPMLTLVNLVVLGLSALWYFGDSSISLWIYFVLGFVSMFFIGMVRLLLDRLVVNTIPPDDRIGFSSTISVVFSFVSLGVGLAGGALADVSTHFSFDFPHEYSLTFGFMGVLALINFSLSLFLKEGGSITANQFLSVMAHPKNLKTIHNIDMLGRISDVARKESILIEIESDQSHLATQEIRKRIKQATLRDKEMIIRSLFSCPRAELEDDLIEEALDTESWWRQSAIFALGAYPTVKSKSTLRRVFRGDDTYMSSVAAKSMARIGDFSGHEKILELLQMEDLDARSCINLVIALSLIERDGTYWSTIFRLAGLKSSHRIIQTLMIIGSLRQSFTPPIEDMFLELNISEKGGFDTLMEEMVDLQLTESDLTTLMDGINEKQYYNLFSWCRHRCKEFTLLDPYETLRTCIVGFRKRHIGPSLALAGLYFTMQLEKIKEKESSVPRVQKPE